VRRRRFEGGLRPRDFTAPCHDCGTNTLPSSLRAPGEWYLVFDEVWAEAGMPYSGFLCIGCLEQRLGRRLDRADFKRCRVNQPDVDPGWHPRSARLKNRLEVERPRRVEG
jgi:hypothetical protein